jgi:hypothetical protein
MQFSVSTLFKPVARYATVGASFCGREALCMQAYVCVTPLMKNCLILSNFELIFI